jgi:hypothetical protein
MIVKSYKAKNGGRLSDKDAERIGGFLEAKVGEVGTDAENLVALAKPAKSPIHKDFEWDDTIAGHQYRLEQARNILRSIMVVYTNGESTEPTRAYHHVVVEIDGEMVPAYVPSKVVWESPDLAAQVIDDAKRELATWAKRYKEYESLSEAHGLVTSALELISV